MAHMKYKKTVLPNGMRIITVPLAESQSAIGMALVETGSDYESKEQNGLSHFLEHMCFKGTTNRSAEQIRLEIDGMGAATNAFTTNEFTGYYAKAHYSKIDKVIDFVSDLYLNPTFPEREIEVERGVIIEEINMYEDLPQQTVRDVWDILLHPDQPAGRSVIGTKENVRAFKQEDFMKYHALHYVPAKTVFVVAGNIDDKKVVAQIKGIFAKIADKKVVKRPKTKFSQVKPQVAIRHKKTDQTHLIMGFRSFDMYSEKNYALRVAATILGRGFSSRLIVRLREELGICYYAGSAAGAHTDRGEFLAYAGVTNARTHEAVGVIMEEFRRLLTEEIPAAELKKAKDYMIGNFSIRLETSEDMADYFGFQELLHEDILKPNEYVKKIQKVTTADIKKVLKQIMKEKGLNLAMIGPFAERDKESFEKLLRI